MIINLLTRHTLYNKNRNNLTNSCLLSTNIVLGMYEVLESSFGFILPPPVKCRMNPDVTQEGGSRPREGLLERPEAEGRARCDPLSPPPALSPCLRSRRTIATAPPSHFMSLKKIWEWVSPFTSLTFNNGQSPSKHISEGRTRGHFASQEEREWGDRRGAALPLPSQVTPPTLAELGSRRQ